MPIKRPSAHGVATVLCAIPAEAGMRLPAVFLSILMLAGCASFSHDGGVGDVSGMVSQRGGLTVARNDAGIEPGLLRQSLAESLTADDAARIALANNRAFQASLAELGATEADTVRAGRLRNPGFSFSRVRGGDDSEIERGVMFDIAGLLTLPWRSGIARQRFEQAKRETALEALRLSAEARRAWVNAIAAAEKARYMEQVKTSAEAGAELAQKMQSAGNFSRLDAARQQAFHADTAARLAFARQDAAAARERLIRIMGLSDNVASLRLPGRLPDLPSALRKEQDVEAQALSRRLDLQLARADLDASARSLRVEQATAFVDVLDAGYVNKSHSGGPRQNGYEVSLEIPVFDWDSKDRKARSLYEAAAHRTADLVVRARSEAREAWSAYLTAYEVARTYHDEILPLRRKISDEMALRYNGMLASVFELLADAREQAASVSAALDAQRNFWLADIDLQMAIDGSGGSASEAKGMTAFSEPAAQH